MEKYLTGEVKRPAMEERLQGPVRAKTKRNTRVRILPKTPDGSVPAPQ
jgi:hypothetical protein